MPDKYDKAIDYLTKNPDQIWANWACPSITTGGCLFQFATPNGHARHNETIYGCLTTIRSSEGHPFGGLAYTPELTEAIQADERIPECGRKIKVEDLPVFAQWQRHIDRELNRV